MRSKHWLIAFLLAVTSERMVLSYSHSEISRNNSSVKQGNNEEIAKKVIQRGLGNSAQIKAIQERELEDRRYQQIMLAINLNNFSPYYLSDPYLHRDDYCHYSSDRKVFAPSGNKYRYKLPV